MRPSSRFSSNTVDHLVVSDEPNMNNVFISNVYNSKQLNGKQTNS